VYILEAKYAFAHVLYSTTRMLILECVTDSYFGDFSVGDHITTHVTTQTSLSKILISIKVIMKSEWIILIFYGILQCMNFMNVSCNLESK